MTKAAVITAGLAAASMAAVRAPCKVGVSFSPAGLLTPFHFGAAKRLEELKWITPKTSLAGSSGGSLAAVTTALGLNYKETLSSCSRIAVRCREEGTYRTLALALRDELQTLIPQTAAAQLNARPAQTNVAFTEVWPTVTPRFVSDWRSTEDVIEVLTASCTIPFYFSGSISSKVRDTFACDGIFACPPWRFGCPATLATQVEILITPFRASKIGLLEPRPWLADTKIVSVISSELLSPAQWPYSTAQLLRLALAPPEANDIAAVYDELFLAGSCAVDEWTKLNPLLLQDYVP